MIDRGGINYKELDRKILLKYLSDNVDNGVQTRADRQFPNTDLEATHTPRYIVEIYHDNILYKRINQSSSLVEFRLVTNQAYEFLVWVDYVKKTTLTQNLNDLHYDTSSSLKEIKMIGDYANSDHSRDAFFYSFKKEKKDIGNQTNSFDITCKRPFGQLNVKTTDWDFTRNISKITPTSVQISFTVYNKFNVLKGEPEPLNAPVTFKYSAPQSLAGSISDNACQLTCDYIFAPTEGQYIIPDTEITLFNEDGDKISHTANMLFNLPIKRNYKTNVSGMLMSKSGKVTVNVSNDWDDDLSFTEGLE